MPLLIFANRLHLCVPIVFSLFLMREASELERRRFVTHSTAIAVLVPLAVWASFSMSAILIYMLPTLVAGWATWHFYLQDRGVLSLYRSRQPNITRTQVNLDRAACLIFSLLNPIQYWFRTGYRFQAFNGQLDFSWADRILPWPDVRWAGAAFFLFYLVMQLRNRALLTPRSLYVAALFGQFLCMSNLQFLPPFFEYLIRVVNHNITELSLQFQMWKNQQSFVPISKSRWAVAGAAMAISVGLLMLIAFRFPFIYPIENGFFDIRYFISFPNAWVISGLVSVFIVLNLLHFLSGHYAYNFTNPHVRKLLKFP